MERIISAANSVVKLRGIVATKGLEKTAKTTEGKKTSPIARNAASETGLCPKRGRKSVAGEEYHQQYH
jgi:hypothetical protein